MSHEVVVLAQIMSLLSRLSQLEVLRHCALIPFIITNPHLLFKLTHRAAVGLKCPSSIAFLFDSLLFLSSDAQFQARIMLCSAFWFTNLVGLTSYIV